MHKICYIGLKNAGEIIPQIPGKTQWAMNDLVAFILHSRAESQSLTVNIWTER